MTARLYQLLAALLIFAALFTWGVHELHARDARMDAAGYARAVAEFNVKLLRVHDVQLEKQEEVNTKVEEGAKKYEALKQKSQADARSARAELERLQQLASTKSPEPGPASGIDPGAQPRVDAGPGPFKDLFLSCARTLTDLGQEADGLEDRVVGLQEYIKALPSRVSLKQPAPESPAP